MTRGLRLGWVLGVLGCGGYQGPPCEEVDTRAFSADTSGEVPVFTFDGDQPNYLVVFEGDVTDSVESSFDWYTGERARWRLDCTCTDGSGEVGCKDRLDQDLRACIESPVTYGDRGSPRAIVERRPAPLVPGEVYSAVVGTYCNGERHQLDSVNGGDPFHDNHVEALAVFTAP
jgi:hypothetical protein